MIRDLEFKIDNGLSALHDIHHMSCQYINNHDENYSHTNE